MTDSPVIPSESLNSTSLSLLERARQNEPSAWEKMVELYTPLVYVWCRRCKLQPNDAADVGQEVFRAVARKLVDFHADRAGDTFRGWLRTITRNKVRDHIDKLRNAAVGAGGSELHQLVANLTEAETDDSQAELSDDRHLLYHRALELLRTEFEERTWTAFWKVVVEDKSPEAVAQEQGLTVNAVYLAKSRVLRRLKEEFSNLIEDCDTKA
jgi:RNA polymerase sigma-70 factor (ECF subfamily)